MGNCLEKLIGSAQEETVPSNVHSLPTLDQTTGLDTITLEECSTSVDEVVAFGKGGCARLSSEQASEYTSIRAEAMMRSRSEFLSDAAHQIEHSKAHWSELEGFGDSDEDMDEEAVIRENLEIFAQLRNDPRWTHIKDGPFFGAPGCPSKVGQKIAEGGQAEIYEFVGDSGNVLDGVLLKVFKKGSRISQLRQQWPSGVLQQEIYQVVAEGLIMEEKRFAFGMIQCWGDLRKLIDQAMQAKNNQGPPFPFEWNGVAMHALHLMKRIAWNMHILHEKGIVHRDMKASNILLHEGFPYPHVVVADFECSIGVVGTGFWRAPEILLGLKKRSDIDFSEKVDVYGYAMTCFEIVTGLLPFEGELEAWPSNYDLVIEGRRPTLPKDLDVTMRCLIER